LVKWDGVDLQPDAFRGDASSIEDQSLF